MINGRKKIGELFSKIGRIFGKKKHEPIHGVIEVAPKKTLREKIVDNFKGRRKNWRRPKRGEIGFGRHVYFGTFSRLKLINGKPVRRPLVGSVGKNGSCLRWMKKREFEKQFVSI